MAQTTLAKLAGILPRGRTKWLIIPTLTGNGTLAQVSTSGSDISNQVVDWSGWTMKTSLVDTGAQGDRFIPNQAGDIKPDSCSLMCKFDPLGVDVTSVLHKDDVTNVIILDNGPGPTQFMDVWPGVVVANIATQRTSANTTQTLVLVEFAIPLQPVLRVAYPTV